MPYLDKLIESNPAPQGRKRDAFDQYLRELLLAQSSDWAFMMHAQTTQACAEARVNEHINNMRTSYEQIMRDEINLPWLDSLKAKWNIFPDTDLFELYKNAGA